MAAFIKKLEVVQNRKNLNKNEDDRGRSPISNYFTSCRSSLIIPYFKRLANHNLRGHLQQPLRLISLVSCKALLEMHARSIGGGRGSSDERERERGRREERERGREKWGGRGEGEIWGGGEEGAGRGGKRVCRVGGSVLSRLDCRAVCCSAAPAADAG